jgi:hypothetical protein
MLDAHNSAAARFDNLLDAARVFARWRRYSIGAVITDFAPQAFSGLPILRRYWLDQAFPSCP